MHVLISDDSTLVCTTTWQFQEAIVSIDTESGIVTRIDRGAEDEASMQLAALGDSIAFAVETGYNLPGRLLISSVGKWEWVPVAQDLQIVVPDGVSEVINSIQIKPFAVQPTVGPDHPVQSVFLRKEGSEGKFGSNRCASPGSGDSCGDC